MKLVRGFESFALNGASYRLEKEINDWVLEENVEIIDVRITSVARSNRDDLYALVTYEKKEDK